jgi:hypothetical protein
MPFSISPKHSIEDFPSGLTIDDKIEVFIARVEGWLIGPAMEMIANGVTHRAFALMSIVTSYFEMIGRYTDGYLGSDKSGYYFKYGLKLVFRDMALPDGEDLLDGLCDRVRNGLYHVGMTKPRVLLVDANSIPGSIGYNDAEDLIAVAPDTLVNDLKIHFSAVADELKDRKNASLRANFETRFDYDNA